MRFEAKWLPGGPMELAKLPLQAQRELKELSIKHAETEAIYTQYVFLGLAQAILAADRILKTLGAAKAKESWDDYVLANFDGSPLLIWPAETFADDLKAMKEKTVWRQVGATDDEGAVKAIEAFSKSLAEKAAKIDRASVEELKGRPLLALYWRLRASNVKSIITPAGEKVVDWSLEPEARKAAMALLAEVADDDDLGRIKEKGDKPLDMEDYRPRDAADVEGKAVSSWRPSTALRPASSPSSAAPAGPGSPSQASP